MSREERRAYQRMMKNNDPYAPPARGMARRRQEQIAQRRAKAAQRLATEPFITVRWLVVTATVAFLIGLIVLSLRWDEGAEAALVAGRERAGSIGSLGLHIQGEVQERTVYTTPDPLVLHHELARLLAAGTELVTMEATSHALVQERIHGLHFRMGIFTNLLPLEHSEYHEGFDGYVRAKTRFFRHLLPGAPLIYNQDGDRYIVIASKGGADTHPEWYLNLVANPEVEVQVKADRFTARARTATKEEKERYWPGMAQMWPDYDNYQAKTSREIPLVILERV
jgi:deazaflavin-dependent oxidoreductase (nitroreductase family)